MVWMVSYGIKKCLAHVVGGTIEHDRIRLVLDHKIVDGVRVSRREDLVAEVSQREG